MQAFRGAPSLLETRAGDLRINDKDPNTGGDPGIARRASRNTQPPSSAVGTVSSVENPLLKTGTAEP